MPVSTITLQGKNIIVVDCSEQSALTKEEIILTLKQGSKAIATFAPNTALVITNVTGTRFSIDAVEALKAYANKNTPYIKASAIVGLRKGVSKIIFNSIISLTKRKFYVATSIDDAKRYLDSL